MTMRNREDKTKAYIIYKVYSQLSEGIVRDLQIFKLHIYLRNLSSNLVSHIEIESQVKKIDMPSQITVLSCIIETKNTKTTAI